MWVFCQEGFFSVVDTDSRGKTVAVRARARRDLVRLRNKRLRPLVSEEALREFEIQDTPHRDYPCRIHMPKALWIKVATAIAASIDYTDFKGRITHIDGRERHNIYEEVWSTLHGLGKCAEGEEDLLKSRSGKKEDESEDVPARAAKSRSPSKAAQPDANKPKAPRKPVLESSQVAKKKPKMKSLDRKIDAKTLLRIEELFHDLVRERAREGRLPIPQDLPRLQGLLATKKEPAWFPVPGMYGGFSYWLDQRGDALRLMTTSSCRVVEGSEKRHEISPAGIRPLENGPVEFGIEFDPPDAPG